MAGGKSKPVAPAMQLWMKKGAELIETLVTNGSTQIIFYFDETETDIKEMSL